MSTKKYVIVDEIFGIVFNEALSHSDMRSHEIGHVTSAGFCYLNADGNWVCYGKSMSLNLESKPKEDAEIINKLLKE